MKRATLIVFALTALATAQNVPDPEIELAVIIAVEEQEGDLQRAEELYRGRLARPDLAAPVRGLANLRLGLLLKRLGRDDESRPFLELAVRAGFGVEAAAQGQERDLEREQELRAKAQALVERVLHQSNGSWNPPLHGIASTDLARQLLWLGEAAVPVVVATLQRHAEGAAAPVQAPCVAGLAGFLWRTGGEGAAKFLESCTAVEDVAFRREVARTAFQLQDAAMMRVAAKFLFDPAADDVVVQTLLNSSSRSGGGVERLDLRFAADWIVEAGLRGPTLGMRRMFDWAGRARRDITPTTLAALHARVAELLASTDPELGTAAHDFLLSETSQQSRQGIAMLFDELPRMRARNVPRSLPPAALIEAMGPADAAALIGHLDACVRRFAADGAAEPPADWLRTMMFQLSSVDGAGGEARALDWIDLGYDVWGLLQDHVTATNATAILDRAVDDHSTQLAVKLLANAQSLPSELCGRLIELAKVHPGSASLVAPALGATGNPAAAQWLIEQYRVERDPYHWSVEQLVRLCDATGSEEVRAALREVASDGHVTALMTLLALGDLPALDIVLEKQAWGWLGKPGEGAARSSRPSRPGTVSRGRPSDGNRVDSGATASMVTMLQYLLSEDQASAHRYPEARLHDLLRRGIDHGLAQIDLRRLDLRVIPDRHLMAIGASWAVQALCDRLGYRELDPERRAALGRWARGVLAGDGPLRLDLLRSVRGADYVPIQREVEALLDSADDELAEAAARVLVQGGALRKRTWRQRFAGHRLARVRDKILDSAVPIDADDVDYLLPLLRDDDRIVRYEAARKMGALVAIEAVPALLVQLRDLDDGVRKQAAESLKLIRFYHEQQAHWDRVLAGLDSSPASAAEKLLLQARPDQPKRQRILAIDSLAVLGVPEALPFLIDWTADPDPEIAARAGKAITDIHLRPRK
ncbi:MAG: hypothetical protein KDC98_00730 [Planctomycetes bacterium]|nr:hypothetical protein [Planctomycetota bacterium]